MAPSFVQRARTRYAPDPIPQLPPAPPVENPIQEAMEQWASLRSYAQEVLEIAHQTAEANRNLIAENAALQRQIDQLHAQVSEVTRENRIAQSYAQNLRSRAGAVKEALENMERESLQFASQSVRGREYERPEERAEVEEVVSQLARINPRTDKSEIRLPPNSWSDR